jgi:outer membrane receptor protein involved in Fe transport
MTGITKWLFLSVILCTLGMQTLFAQTTGKIIGNVEDANSGEAIAGANVWLEGTSMGAATDLNGDFYIINIPPGTYVVTIQMLGYETVSVQDVRVSVNRSAHVNVKINEAIMEGEVIVVSADKISYKKDQTSSIKNVSDAQIAVLPVETLDEVIEMQAGVVGGHFRGGRLNEVSYLIDGMQVDEAFQGESRVVELEKEVVSDLEVITGTFNAEYGKAMSGIVNMVTKTGGNNLHGYAMAQFGNYVTSNNDIFIGLNSGDFNRIQDYKLQLEGPLLKNYVFFIANARYLDDKGYLNGIRRFNVDDYSNFAEPDIIGNYESPWDVEINDTRYYSEHTGDGEYVAMLLRESLSLFGKLTFIPYQNLKLALLYTRNDREESPGYLHSYKYNPDGAAKNHYESSMLSLQVNHLLSRRIFYDLKFSYNDYWYGRYLYEDPLDPRYVNNNYSQGAGGFSSGGTDKTHVEQFSQQTIGKFDLTWQINKHHSLRTGLQYTQYKVKNKPIYVRDKKWNTAAASDKWYDPDEERMMFNPWEPEIYPLESIEMDQYKKEPFDFSWYIQDKMEYEDLVINYGLRHDYFDPNTVYPSNRRNPANQGEYEDPSFQSTYPKADPQIQWSPRIGLSYTLGNSAVLHFSYGHFFQMPPFFALYTNHRFMVPVNNFGTEHGNPQINSQKTVKYEMGLWQELMPGLGLEVSVYYSDIYDLLTAVVWTTYNQIQYAVYDNKDYANTKGLEFKLDWTYKSFMTNFNYTLQYTRGNADNPRSTYNRLAQNQDPVAKLIPLGWDQRHTASMSLGYGMENYAFNLVLYYNSGFPYTIEPIAESRLAKQNILPNNATRPTTYRVDLQGHYDIPISNAFKTRLFLYVKNMLDILNEEQVYGSTGRAYTTILGNVAEQTFRSNYNTVYDQYENPGMYSAPREIRLGVGFIF